MQKPLTGKTALVTGAAGPIGWAACQVLAEDGCDVIAADIHAEGLEGENIRALVLDVSDPDAVKAAAGQVGQVDILVNNAGVLSNHKSAGTTADEWRRVMSVNLDGAFYLSQAFLPGMREKGWGRIINMASLAMKVGGITAGTAYTTSKGGMAALTFSLAREVAAEGVTVNAIAPAYVMTPMVSEQLTEEQRQKILGDIPVGRFCEPEEVVHAVRFLVSPLAGFITGEIIDINGGLHFD
ncbi:MAG: SDR family oxidoreductase [Rhodospirillaceae bacterium]|nr:SDR family oxidoreductase [Rhodospirillaceae bacterium]